MPDHEPEAVTGSKRSREDEDRPASFQRPAEAGALEYAELWYYRDNEGSDQGPHPAQNMRAWMEAGYFAYSVTVAASYYGEIPETMWRIDDLWEDPKNEAFVTLRGAVDVAEEILPEFQPSGEFCGAREHYVFKADFFGTGYYIDQPPPIVVTASSLEREKEAKEARARRLMAAQHYSGEGPT